MLVHAQIMIAGKEISFMAHGYRRWFFRREDRFIRTKSDADEAPLEYEYLYVITADELRKRLQKAGFSRTSLEEEFDAYGEDRKVRIFTDQAYAGDWAEVAARRKEAVKRATLDDWLAALKAVCCSDRTRDGSAVKPWQLPNDFVDINLLANSMKRGWMNDGCYLPGSDLQPYLPGRERPNFPCSSLECVAMAMLESVPGNAECVLDVTALVEHGMVYCFDDLIADETSTPRYEHDPLEYYVELGRKKPVRPVIYDDDI